MRVIMLARGLFIAIVTLWGGRAFLKSFASTPEDAEAELAAKMSKYGVRGDK